MSNVIPFPRRTKKPGDHYKDATVIKGPWLPTAQDRTNAWSDIDERVRYIRESSARIKLLMQELRTATTS